MEFRDQAVLITGTATGIGRSLAIGLAARGADLALVDIDAEGAKATAEAVRAEGRRAEVYQADVSERAGVESAVARAWDDLGPIGLVCANAGVCPIGPLLEMEPENVEWVMGVNLFGVLHTVRAYVNAAREAGRGGHIMLTGSENSVSLPHALRRVGLGPYCMTKHGVLAMAETLRYELAQEGFGVSVLMPGPVQTAIGEGGRNRPERLGGPLGPAEVDSTLLTPGVPFPDPIQADAAARIAIEGLEAGRFMIPTHAHLAEYSAARQAELDEATRATRFEPGA